MARSEAAVKLFMSRNGNSGLVVEENEESIGAR
jgi:hypothetical protein